MLDAHEFADAIRLGVVRSGIASDVRATEMNYLPLAMAIVDYLKTHLQVTVPEGELVIDGDNVANSALSCEVS